MLKKLRVYAAMYGLDSFTVDELAARAQVSPSTVNTVLKRAPANWFDTSKRERSGARGGQRIQRTLSNEGRTVLLKSLGSAAASLEVRHTLNAEGRTGLLRSLGPASPSVRLAPEPSGSQSIPLGLQSARDTLNKLHATDDEELALALREDALRDLEWAQAEAQGPGFESRSTELLYEIESVRKLLAGSPLAESTQTGHWEGLGEPTPFNRTQLESPSPLDFESVFSDEYRLLGDLTQVPICIVGQVGNDAASHNLAFAAAHLLQGSLALSDGESVSFDQTGRSIAELSVRLANADLLMKVVGWATSRSITRAAPHFCLAVNSAVELHDVNRVLEVLGRHATGLKVSVLDSGKSAHLATFAQSHNMLYEPDASKETMHQWLSETVKFHMSDDVAPDFQSGSDSNFASLG